MATLAPLIDQINVDAMPDNPANAVRELRSIGTDAAVTLAGQWSPRHRTNIEYGFGNRLFESGSGLDSFNHSVSLGHSWNLTSSSAVRLTYREGRLETESALPSIAEAIERERIRSKSMELGVDHRRRVSRTRNINLSAGLGTATMRSETIEDGVLENRSPSGFVSVQFDLARSWAVSADFRRGGTVLEGISGHAFMRNFVTFSAGGRIHRKIQLTFTGDQSTGDATELGGMGSFQMRSGTSQMSYALSNNSSLLVSYTYFQHRLTQFQDLIVGFPPEYGRQAIRIGFSFNVPLVEARPSTGRRQ
jgi:hypothetical protein